MTMTDTIVGNWVAGYVAAWQSNDLDEIRALFDADAVYRTTPFADSIEGRDAIVADWLHRRDEPGTWAFTHEILAVSGDLAVVRGTTVYFDPEAEYANLWLIRLGENGLCRDFAEWYVQRPEE